MHRNKLSGNEIVKSYITAGNATFTVLNTETLNRFTFKVVKHKAANIFFVGLLTGCNNESDFSYMGIINDTGSYRITHKSKISFSDISQKAFKWIWNCLTYNTKMNDCVEIRHEGRCGRCGRKLTTPESIDAGYGPECIKVVHG